MYQTKDTMQQAKCHSPFILQLEPQLEALDLHFSLSVMFQSIADRCRSGIECSTPSEPSGRGETSMDLSQVARSLNVAVRESFS